MMLLFLKMNHQQKWGSDSDLLQLQPPQLLLPLFRELFSMFGRERAVLRNLKKRKIQKTKSDLL